MSNPQVSFRHTEFNGPSILKTRRDTICRVTVKTQLQQLRDTGRYDCFKLKWHPTYDEEYLWPVPKSLFWDSDIAKWIEGACYFLAEEFDTEVDAAVRELVTDIRSAQQEDGYLNVYFTVVEPKLRWSNLRDMHELYNAGHLIEAALAHRDYYKNDLLLEPIEQYVRLIHSLFGPGEEQLHGYPGHPEIELALLRLFSATGNQNAYGLAQYFIEERGNPTGQNGLHFYDWEAKHRGDSPWLRPNTYPESGSHWYNQAHAPIIEQQSVQGHAVRAMYLLAAVADLLCIDKHGTKSYLAKAQWLQSLDRLWRNMVDKKMYATGGIGAMKQWEGFGIDYFLPQGTDEGGCYAETCASIGVMMLAERLLELDLDSRYADVMELCLFNGVMTAMSLDGKAFTYVNQLASSDEDKSCRDDWFWCACCPPNLMRLFGSLGGYLWDFGERDGTVFVNVHLYTTAKVTFEAGGKNLSLQQKSNWPWEGNVLFQLDGCSSSLETTIRLRIPAWSKGNYVLTPSCPSAKIEKGYLNLPPSYTLEHAAFAIQIGGFSPRHVAPHPYTNQQTLAVARGPIIYCVEDQDNSWEANHFKNIAILAGSKITEEQRVFSQARESYIALHSVGWERRVIKPTAESSGPDLGVEIETGKQMDLTFVPYYFRANREGRGQMRVGLLRK